MSAIPDPIAAGLARGWQVVDASTLRADTHYEADVVIIGTGAGGGVSAEVLSQAGLKVLLIEEGPLPLGRDFRLLESDAYPQLYQACAARQTQDKAITILQGRTVGGSTTVNWTSSFRTPPGTLTVWNERYDLPLTEAEMRPWFEQIETRLSIHDWPEAPNANNAVLARGAQQLGISHGRIRRNVKGCWNLGYCGMGCPTHAKQSMLVTTIPAALDAGARLLTRCRAWRLNLTAGEVSGLECQALDSAGLRANGVRITVRARHYVLAGGAINTPALLLRSRLPDASGRLGKRTFLHPTVLSAALFAERVDAWHGAPQTVYSDHFLHTQEIDGPLGYKLETPPVHPLLASVTLTGLGESHAALMRQMPHLHVMLALLRDGFHVDSQGGEVSLDDDGHARLAYPLNDPLWEAARRAWLSMAELQFAAGARQVLPIHEDAVPYRSWPEAREAIRQLPLEILRARWVSAHVMGGAMMGKDASRGVVNADGACWGMRNLSVLDGSVFPTSIGANPQLSVYALALRNATKLAQTLGHG